MNAYIVTYSLDGNVHTLAWPYEKYGTEHPETSFTIDKTFTIYCAGKLKLFVTNAVVVEHVENYTPKSNES